jgi:hypothetical protein
MDLRHIITDNVITAEPLRQLFQAKALLQRLKLLRDQQALYSPLPLAP